MPLEGDVLGLYFGCKTESVPSWGGKKSDFRISVAVVEVKVDRTLKRKYFGD